MIIIIILKIKVTIKTSKINNNYYYHNNYQKWKNQNKEMLV